MSKSKSLKHRLRSDPDGMLGWMDGGQLPRMSYESAEITGIQLSMMLDGHDDVYILTVLPGDEYGSYDAWLRREVRNERLTGKAVIMLQTVGDFRAVLDHGGTGGTLDIDHTVDGTCAC